MPCWLHLMKTRKEKSEEKKRRARRDKSYCIMIQGKAMLILLNFRCTLLDPWVAVSGPYSHARVFWHRRDETADTIWELQFSSQDDFVTCQGVMQVVVALLNEAKESWCQGPCPSDWSVPLTLTCQSYVTLAYFNNIYYYQFIDYAAVFECTLAGSIYPLGHWIHHSYESLLDPGFHHGNSPLGFNQYFLRALTDPRGTFCKNSIIWCWMSWGPFCFGEFL